MAFMLATSTPVIEEHTKLIDCLSEPSSQLIHHIAHLSEEETLAETNASCFIFVRVHGFASYNCNFCQKALPLTILLSTHLRSKKLLIICQVLNSSPLQTMH